MCALTHTLAHTRTQRHTETTSLQAQTDTFVGFVLAHQQEICYCTSKTIKYHCMSLLFRDTEKERLVGSVSGMGKADNTAIIYKKENNVIEKAAAG